MAHFQGVGEALGRIVTAVVVVAAVLVLLAGALEVAANIPFLARTIPGWLWDVLEPLRLARYF